MTTNQTIDGVPRKLLERIEYLIRATGVEHMCVIELRALLDAPIPFPGYPPVPEDRKLPAAQPQGDPVAWRFRVSDSSDWFATTKASVAEMFHNSSDGGQAQPLYAEQPAPVAPQKYDDTLLPFVELMRKELHANAGKGDRPGWLSMSSDTCLLEIIYHFGKLQASVKRGDGDGMAEYGADVANLCMMLLDICGVINLVQHAEQPAPVAAAQTCCGSCPGGCVYGLKA